MGHAIITTSWDDGHPRDLRIAELLEKHGLAGTFYLPAEGPEGGMSRSEIRELSRSFEIGAHTLHHSVLTEVPPDVARREVEDSKHWVEDLTGTVCTSFCPPKGRFRPEHLAIVCDAGFVQMRTAELLSFAPPAPKSGVLLMPTTVHAFTYTAPRLLRNVTKRFAFAGLYDWARHCRQFDWVKMVECLLPLAIEQEGVFHLWGHSWEIERRGEWDKLERAFEILAEHRRNADYRTNSEIGKSSLAAA
jgi:peptidoglycan/xylan/chitin deacetylase (PgdA/CDA1 family)